MISSKSLKGTRKNGIAQVEGDQYTWAWESSLRMVNHSPTGPEWGYFGSGPAQLALAILLWSGVSERKAGKIYQDFKDQVVGRFPYSGFEISKKEVDEWCALR